MELSRRDFIRTGALTAGSLAAAGALTACSTTSAAADDGENLLTADALDRKWSFQIPPTPIDSSLIGETKETEVVIVGAGTAGLCAAVSAAEAGAKVILFAMGSAPIGRGGSNFAFHSKYRESLGLEPVQPYPYMTVQATGNSFNFDQNKWSRWYQHSEEAMNWLIDIMDEPKRYQLYLEQIPHGTVMDDPTCPEWDPLCTHDWICEADGFTVVGDGQPYVVNTLADKAKSLGAEILYNITAQQLVRGGVPNGQSGRVDAVIATDQDGNYIEFKGAKAVVLATGDFSRDKDMMRCYCPQAWEWFTNYDAEDFDPENSKVYGGLYTGQGQKMGLWVGAAWQKTFPNAAMGGSFQSGPDNCGFLVDYTGKRFCNEGNLPMGYTSLQYNHVFKGQVYQIWNEDYATTGQPWPKTKSGYTQPFLATGDILKNWSKQVDAGAYVKADTAEEVIKKLNLPKETIDELKKYNGYCKAGFDADFFKRKELLKAYDKGPFYGCASTPKHIMHTVLGGLRTNLDMQVCDADDEPIPGLYNIGTMIGDSYANCYSFKMPGQNLGMNCVTFGYLTGKTIAEGK